MRSDERGGRGISHLGPAGGLGCFSLLLSVAPLRGRASVGPEAIQQRGVLLEVVGAAVVCLGRALTRPVAPLLFVCVVVPCAALLEHMIPDSHADIRLPAALLAGAA